MASSSFIFAGLVVVGEADAWRSGGQAATEKAKKPNKRGGRSADTRQHRELRGTAFRKLKACGSRAQLTQEERAATIKMEQQLQQLVDQVQRLTTESQNMRQELQNRDVTIAEMRGQLQAQQQAQQQRVAPRGEMMDPKILHKVKPFDGHRASWKTFSFQYRAYLIAQDRRYRDLLERCEDGAQEVDNVNLDAQEEELSTQLYYGLVLAMPEDSVGELIVRNSPVGEGAECWRKLQKEYNPSEAGNVLAMWTKLTDTKFDAKEDVMVSISKLDEDMTRYQKMAGEPVSDLIKRGILTKALKDHDELQKHVFRNSSRLSTYELLRAEVVSALMAERAGARKVTTGRSGHRNKFDSTYTTDVGKSRKRRQRDDSAGAAPSQLRAASEDDSGPEGRGLKKRSHTIDWKYCLPSYHQYVCCSCKKTFEGWRWHFDQWKLDYCAACAEYCLDNWHVTVAGLRPVDEDQSPADDRLRLAPLRNAIMLDSGAQISAIPRSQVTKHNYTPTDSNVVGLKGIGGEEIERYGHVELNLSRGGEVTGSSTVPSSHLTELSSYLYGVTKEPADENKIPKVMFDIFYVGTDQLAAKYKLKGGYFSIREKMSVTKAELDQAVSVLNVIDCKILAQATLYANKETDDYKVSFLLGVLEAWGHTTVILQTDQEPATMALAQAVRDRRSHSTLVRGSPPFSKQSAGYAEGANKLAAGLLRAYKLKLEHKLGCEIKMTDPIVPWLVNSVGWMITRFQPRSHGGSSYKMLYGKEYNGEIAEMGEQVWYRISARVAAGRGKWEARFAKGIWVGKSELDDTHLVIDPERGVQKVRTVRRMPEEFRWQPELIQHIRVTPWKQTPDKSSGTIGRSMYITERMIDAHGPTDECRKCSTGYGSHSAACRQRFETIQADLLREKLAKDPVAPEATVVVPAPAAGSPAPGATFGEVPQVKFVKELRSHFGDPEDQQVEQMVEVSAELHEKDQWSPKTIHYDYYTGEPLDEDLYQKGRDDELQAMKDYGVYVEVATSTATDGKHIGGFPIAHMKEGKVRWRFVATEVNKYEVREDNHQGTPPLMIVRATLSRAASSPTSSGQHLRKIQVWDVRKAFFNADLDETIYVHPGRELCPPGRCWWLRKAMNGTRKASQMWGELVRTTMDDGHWECLVGTPNVFYLPASPNTAPFDEDSTAICHGDDFLAEGYDEQLDELDELLKQQFEVTASARLGPGAVGQTTYLKRTIGYTDKLPGCEEPGFFWTADPKHVDFMIKWTQKRGLQCKTYLIETQRPCNLKIYSDSTAGRGMCSRVGVGKVRHLELRYLWIQERLRLKAFELHKEDTSKMTADMLTKYSEWPTIEKHCTTLNLRFGKQMTGLSAMAVFTEVVTKASGEKVTVYGGSDEVAVCPAPVSHYVESEEFRFYLMLGLVMVTAASTFLLGCWCGCYFKNFYDKFFLQGAVSPASGSTCPPSARADVEFKTVCAQQDKGARHKLLNTFLVAELRAVLKAKSLAVSGIKEDLVTRMIKHGGVLSDRQAKEIEQLRVMATAHGPLAKLSLQDISSPEAAQKWIETFKGECRDRSRGSQVIHGEG
ncbi:unnamed protein product [Prorocentrum cordatum]|uniref:Retrovirus-related Pol polyprotein from transposon TNT 1-94 n=1 Tax=Prorocentrum cordatum TaxID=2364126 RepID=A0ABN9SB50_9DINO|nr:unnamed protein product [Polarella glacialis]